MSQEYTSSEKMASIKQFTSTYSTVNLDFFFKIFMFANMVK